MVTVGVVVLIPKITMNLANLRLFKSDIFQDNSFDVNLFLSDCLPLKITNNNQNKNNFIGVSHQLLGLALLVDGDIPSAIDEFTNVVEDYDSNDVTRYLLGIAEYRSGEYENALMTWSDPNIANRLMISGDECNKMGLSYIGDDYYRLASQIVSRSDEEIYRKILLYFSKAHDDAAFQNSLEKYLSVATPNTQSYDETLGEAFLSQGDYQKALEHYVDAIKKAPKNSMNWYWAGVAAYNIGSLDIADDYFYLASELSPRFIDSYIYLGHLSTRLGNYSDANGWYLQALQLEPNNSWVLSSLAKMEIELGNFQDAIKYISKAKMVDQRGYLFELEAQAWEGLKDLGQAKQVLLQAVKVDPVNVFYLSRLANICVKLNDELCASKVFRNILEVDPNNVSAKNGLYLLGIK